MVHLALLALDCRPNRHIPHCIVYRSWSILPFARLSDAVYIASLSYFTLPCPSQETGLCPVVQCTPNRHTVDHSTRFPIAGWTIAASKLSLRQCSACVCVGECGYVVALGLALLPCVSAKLWAWSFRVGNPSLDVVSAMERGKSSVNSLAEQFLITYQSSKV